jgi:hypothetical protein
MRIMNAQLHAELDADHQDLILRNNRAVITDEIMSNLEAELNRLWTEYNIIDYHKNVFFRYLKLLPRESAAAMMAKEVEDLK